MNTATQSANTRAATAPDALISVRGLQTHFFTDEGIVRAVDGVDFDLKRGSTLGIVAKVVAASRYRQVRPADRGATGKDRQRRDPLLSRPR